MTEPKPLLFVSHAAVDEEIAASIKRHLQAAFSELDIFVSSDPEDLPPGSAWVEKILEALNRAKLILALTTERGLSRKWVWFESGRTWHSDLGCIPCCLGKIRKSGLPPPFNLLQAVNLDEEAGMRAMLKECEKTFQLTAEPLDMAAILNELIRLDIRAEERQRSLEDPFSSELQREIESVMGALDSGSKEVLRLLLKYGEMTEAVARGKAMASGKRTNETMFLIGLENRTGWLLKTQSSPHPHVSREEDRYEIAPKLRPYLQSWFDRH
jgi:TIR domain